MKKVLFATTALIATAGVASAQGVSLSGSAEMGITGGDVLNGAMTAVATNEVQFSQNVDVTFTLSGTTDNGLTFGASVDLDEAAGIAGPETNHGGATVFISGNFGTLTMGDTDGAVDWALSDANTAGSPGSINDAETGHAGYNGSFGDPMGSDGQILRYDYSFGNFGFAVSHQQSANPVTGVVPLNPNSGSTAVGVRYSMAAAGADVALGLGYSTTDFGTATDQEILGLSVAATFGGGFSATAGYVQWTDVAGAPGVDIDHSYIGLGYSFDAISLHANYGMMDSNVANADVSGFGFAAGYDLGGGASILLGYGSSNRDNPALLDNDVWSLGLSMSF